MENFKRTIEINDVRLSKYVAVRDSYLEEAKPINDQIVANNAEMQEAMDKAKEVIDRVKEENEKLNNKIKKKAEEFMKKKQQIQDIMEKLQKKEQSHKYEYLESVDMTEDGLQGTMIDALEKSRQETMNQFDNLD